MIRFSAEAFGGSSLCCSQDTLGHSTKIQGTLNSHWNGIGKQLANEITLMVAHYVL